MFNLDDETQETLTRSDSSLLDNYGDKCIAVLKFRDSVIGTFFDIPIFPDQDLVIGRDESCQPQIEDPRVSKKHLRVYSIIYEKEKYSTYPPLIYCEDLESTNGTYVNDELIGMVGNERTGFLLCDGDVIEIRPGWTFELHQPCPRDALEKDVGAEDLKYIGNRFTVTTRALGCGEYGRVYLARETITSKQVACKIVDLKAAGKKFTQQNGGRHDSVRAARLHFEKEERGKVMREIEILSQLSHPNIINLKKAFHSGNMLYMFTELGTGGDLFSYLESQGGKVDDIHARVITRQVALALHYIHFRGFAHRDIKPENILLAHRDWGCRVILTDFGHAAPFQNSRMTSIVGTDGYEAPEINNRSGRAYTAAVDMWSFGILTLMILTADTVLPPEEVWHRSQAEVAERLLSKHHSNAAMWLDVPPRPRRFIESLLVPDPRKRMTAEQALNHSWYKKPLTEADAMERAYERVIKFWQPRESFEEVTEHLPGSKAHEADTTTKKSKRKFPDSSASPYFSLDRHLHERSAATLMPKRKRILADLNESGSMFVANRAEPEFPSLKAWQLKAKALPDIYQVSSSDIFGTSTQTSAVLKAGSDTDEVSFVPDSQPDVAAGMIASLVRSRYISEQEEL